MSVRQYIGARYVPLYIGAWDKTLAYEPLSVVSYQGNSYTSRQAVPPNVEITDTRFWLISAEYNAQVEQYRQEVLSIMQSLPSSDFDENTTVKDYIDAVNAKLGAGFDDTDTVRVAITSITDAIGTGFDSSHTIAAAITSITDDVTELQRLTSPFNFSGKKFAFIGDSITIGQSGYGTYYEHPWAWTLCNIVGASYHNFSVGGATFQSTVTETTENFREQCYGIVQADWDGHVPDYIFIMLGTNDYGLGADPGGTTYEAVYGDWSTVTSAMKTGITLLRDTFKQAIVIGIIPPFMPGDTTRNSVNLTALDYKTTIKNLYDVMNVPTIDFTTALSCDETNWNEHIWDTTSPRLHPNQDTHDFMGKIAAASMPSVFNRAYTMIAAQNYSGSLDMESTATGSIAWWIDEQNNAHFFSSGVTSTNPNSNTVATIPAFIRPMFVFYDYAIDLNTGNPSYIIAMPNGEFRVGAPNVNTSFHIMIPQMLRRINTGNIRKPVLS